MKLSAILLGRSLNWWQSPTCAYDRNAVLFISEKYAGMKLMDTLGSSFLELFSGGLVSSPARKRESCVVDCKKMFSCHLGWIKAACPQNYFQKLGFVRQYLFFLSSFSGIYTVYMNYMLKLAGLCSISLHVTVIFPFLYWQYTDSSHGQRESKLVHLDRTEFFLFYSEICLFSPQSSVCTNYFQTVDMHICAVATVLGEKNGASGSAAEKFSVWMWRIERGSVSLQDEMSPPRAWQKDAAGPNS